MVEQDGLWRAVDNSVVTVGHFTVQASNKRKQ